MYVGNISWDTFEDELTGAFSEFGEVLKCNVVVDATGRSRGFAFITYGSEAEALSAIDALNQTVRGVCVPKHDMDLANTPRFMYLFFFQCRQFSELLLLSGSKVLSAAQIAASASILGLANACMLCCIVLRSLSDF